MALPFPNIAAAAASRTPVNVGAVANDGTGDHLRDAFMRSNARETGLEAAIDQAAANFTDLDARTVSLEGSAQFLNYRGDWATATSYVFTPGVRRDMFRDAGTGDIYVVLSTHTSTTLVADEGLGRIANTDAVQNAAEITALQAALLIAQSDINATEADVIALETHVTNLAAEGPGNGGNLVGASDTPTSGVFNSVQGFVSLWSARQSQIDLRAGMDAIYGAGLWTERTAVGVGSDIGPALEHLMDNSTARTPIYIPPGSWRYVNDVDPAKLAGRRILGVGSQGSRIVYGSTTGSPFHFNGSAGLTGGGLFGLALQLEEGLGDTAVIAIRLEGDATNQADQMEFDDLYVTALGPAGAGASHWQSAFLANGTARQSPQGIRVVTMNNLQLFRCHGAGMFISNGVQWTMDNVGLYAGKGLGMNLYVAGGGAALTNSAQIYARGLVCVELNVTNAQKFDLNGTFTTFATGPSATNGRVFGFGASLSGTLGSSVTFTAS